MEIDVTDLKQQYIIVIEKETLMVVFKITYELNKCVGYVLGYDRT